ncbi:hypothetical protein GCM10009647_003080 [Streptomyces sanglieri]
MTGQDPVHRRGGRSEGRADPGRTKRVGLSRITDNRFRFGCGSVLRGRVRLARAVEQSRIALGVPPSDRLWAVVREIRSPRPRERPDDRNRHGTDTEQTRWTSRRLP